MDYRQPTNGENVALNFERFTTCWRAKECHIRRTSTPAEMGMLAISLAVVVVVVLTPVMFADGVVVAVDVAAVGAPAVSAILTAASAAFAVVWGRRGPHPSIGPLLSNLDLGSSQASVRLIQTPRSLQHHVPLGYVSHGGREL